VTPQQQRAAALLGQGRSQRDAAAEVGVSTRAIRYWLKEPDFEALVRRSREALLDERPTVRSTLEAALLATRRDGSPDWGARVQAARILMAAPPDEEPEDGRDPAAVLIEVFPENIREAAG